ncbi:MAG TPA: 4Fe-4S single cluster domain-containing protein [Kofleriaceae bacterium]|nr:4Fe-4S single cluster domain-containing protein [Kofleriaceae bacterium]
MTPVLVHLHATMPRTRANGPGSRFAIWFQGCSLGCPGCFNPATHPAEPGQRVTVDDLLARIEAEADAIEGVTVSGGEPFEQPDALLALVSALRRRAPRLSILVFSGFTRAEIDRRPHGPAILAAIDVLVDGRFVERRLLGRGLRGSDNQRIHLLGDRYTIDQIEATPVGEIVIGPDGSASVTGVAPLDLSTGGGGGPGRSGHGMVK